MSAASREFSLGVDIGSISVKTALLDGAGDIVSTTYRRHLGRPADVAREAAGEVLGSLKPGAAVKLGLTGTGAPALAEALDVRPTNEMIAIVSAAARFLPDVRTIIDVGGEDSKILCLRKPERGTLVLDDFATNSACAAGTGSFLDQQATRLGVSIEEFAQLALRSERPPMMAGRCSVFAKSDMIHLQQEGCPDYDIIAGLCAAMARNFISVIAKGKPLRPRIAFIGGVASNAGMVRAFRDAVGAGEDDFTVPQRHECMCAIGCALTAGREAEARDASQLADLFARMTPHKGGLGHGQLERLEPVERPEAREPGEAERKAARAGVYLGVDVGSVSTNVVALDRQMNVIARRYLATAGRPIEAVRRGITEVGEELGLDTPVISVGTTGSGRYLIGDFIGADVVKNEITAQATATIAIDPQVDTIFEIGGQDSKYISLRDGAVVDFCMNKVCAAGTGSFLEEQAERLGISIVGDFGREALAAPDPTPLGERCTVFMETALIAAQQEGAKRGDLCAGLAYSIAENYLNRVVAERRVGDRIFFQGAVAFNDGVVSAFRKLTGKSVTVPPDNDVTGAIGVARVAAENAPRGGSTFKGFVAVRDAEYELRSFQCHDCPNGCEIREVVIEGQEPLRYGSRCGKFDERAQRAEHSDIPDLFAERARLQRAALDKNRPGARGTIGIPLALTFYELLPFWTAVLQELGFSVVCSDVTNARMVREGAGCCGAETCLPIKAAHGHIIDLLEKGVDYIFLPVSVMGEERAFGLPPGFNCPYVQALPFMVRASGILEGSEVRAISPVLVPGLSPTAMERGLLAALADLHVGVAEVRRALDAGHEAQAKYCEAMKRRGEEILQNLTPETPAIVVVSRPYNGCDPGLSLNLPKKLRTLGAMAVPLDMLPLEGVDLSEAWPNMYWRYGQRILAAASVVRDDPRLQAMYITNFGCGPDSFITRYFTAEMAGKPYLTIEIDEHSADVGMVTRLEAFLDSLKRSSGTPTGAPPRLTPAVRKADSRVVYVPNMGEAARALSAAFSAFGMEARVYPESNEETLHWGRKFTGGRECFPCIVTVGDMVRIVKSPDFDPDRAAFFMPTTSGSCRFGQYNRLQRMVLDDLGYHDVPIVAPNQSGLLGDELKENGAGFFRLAWRAVVACEVLEQLVRKVRPYELNPGESDRVQEAGLDRICEAISRRENPAQALAGAAEELARVPADRSERRPLIGVVGEIFVRSNEFCNNSVIRRIEGLGGEASMPPVIEWLYHIGLTFEVASGFSGNRLGVFKARAQRFIQRRDELRLIRVAEGAFGSNGLSHEATVPQIWDNARAYLEPWFGEVALSVGKSIDFARSGYAGIVNLMPFTCLPGTITTIILRRMREDHDRIPCISLAFDGVDDAGGQTRLEAFVHQARQYRDIRAAR